MPTESRNVSAGTKSPLPAGTKSPLASVKSKFQSKDKLVSELVGLLSRDSDESKDDMKKRLLSVANKKLLRLHQVATVMGERGGKEKLVASTAETLGRSKDKDYVTKLQGLSAARLLDLEGVARRKAKAAASKPAKPTRAREPAKTAAKSSSAAK
jgi:hypothetical protein